MLSLLSNSYRSGYPGDYLVARIHGRINRRLSNQGEVFENQGMFHENDRHFWDRVSEERKWLYQQMEIKLRKTLAPMLVYFELPGFFLGLRKLEAGKMSVAGEVFAQSIITERLQKNIQTATNPLAVLQKMEKFLAKTPLSIKGLAEAYQDGGLQQYELVFRIRFLEQALMLSKHFVVARFFRRVIDLRNTMVVAKALRWGKKEPQPLIAGGNIRLLKNDRVPSENVLRKMVKLVTGREDMTSSELQPVQLEPLLNQNLAKVMNRQMRSFDPMECCSGYLYHCYIKARQMSRDFHVDQFHEYFSEGGAEGL